MIFEIYNYETLRAAVDKFCVFLSEKQVGQEKIFDARLVLFELLGNVLKHSDDGKAELCGAVSGEYVEMRIITEKTFYLPENSSLAEVNAESGRGIFLVDSVCEKRVYNEDGDLIVYIKL